MITAKSLLLLSTWHDCSLSLSLQSVAVCLLCHSGFEVRYACSDGATVCSSFNAVCGCWWHFGMLNLFFVKIHVKLPQVFTILCEYSRNVRSVKFHIWRENSRYNCAAFSLFYVNFQVTFLQVSTILREYSCNVRSAMRNFTVKP